MGGVRHTQLSLWVKRHLTKMEILLKTITPISAVKYSYYEKKNTYRHGLLIEKLVSYNKVNKVKP